MKEIFPSAKLKHVGNPQVGEKKLQELMEILPLHEVIAVIGYGSAHFPQPGNKPAQFDFVVIVDNLQSFFKQNLQKNPNHYAKLAKKIGAKGMIDLNR